MLIKKRNQSHVRSKCRAFCKKFYNPIGFLLLFFSVNVHCATPEQIKLIQEAAEHHVLDTADKPVGSEVEAQASDIDPRVYATQCPEPLKTSSSSHNGSASYITVLVTCEPDDWKIYVPVKLTLTVPLVTASSPLTRGQVITSQNISISMVNLLLFKRQGFSSTEMVEGAKLKRNVSLGDVITANDICFVCRNETVMIRAQSAGMSITTKGTALSDGILGEQIKVKNDKSNRIIDAKVSGIGEVMVQF
ncbi:flagellar basal body P-ring formation chaperone FlgA [Vibrio porteresiae]|uniref:Flagella basal body P-ring formation protein FlgA n=1 Tax=Vibrio porteresiae DSM 19223 TaxID=1123496 RepID=A0ABZ0QED5_9VIBR|nr:flagellar basal body P-ring formation chaperone FlgA [Vibrio porteresiae]WPC74798.1 flagellar basal body P-ring formation chaperone FlgA [Vibrio porteresiae DSM 19223]